MTQTVIYACICSVFAGLFIELFFRLIKYRDALNKNAPISMTAYGVISGPSNYMSVSQYLSGGERRWLNYFLFRFLPPAVILALLAGVLESYYNIANNLPYLFIGAFVSLILRDIACLFSKGYVYEKLLHMANIFLISMIPPLIYLLSKLINFSYIAPTTQGLIDNLWSSLFVAMLILLYFQMTNMEVKQNDQIAEDIALSNYVVKAYARIKNKYNSVICSACTEYNCSVQLLYAVLIYEDMNRPVILRKLENLVVRLFRLKLTVGIAQVRSDKPMTDEDSIRRAAKILEGSAYVDSGVGDGFSDIKQLEDILNKYNSSKLYARSISQIIWKLRTYANELFQKVNKKMKKRVTFIFDNYSSGSTRRLYRVNKTIGPNDSIRQISLGVALEAKKQGLVDQVDVINDRNAIAIYVSNKEITDGEIGYRESGFGVKYAINEDGTIRVLSGFEPLYHDWTLSELQELIDNNYVKGDLSIIIAVIPVGIGATGWEAIFSWVDFMANTLFLYTTTKSVFGKFKRLLIDWNIRNTVKLWISNGIKYPEQLREFIDVKGEWKLDEVKKRLKLSDEYAIKLLYALGFEPVGDSWRITHSKKSITNRKRWMTNEKKYRKTPEVFE